MLEVVVGCVDNAERNGASKERQYISENSDETTGCKLSCQIDANEHPNGVQEERIGQNSMENAWKECAKDVA